ncbi:hypothetical protein EMPG_12858 [Blastomyces silverae]|uniref:Uncharacterized protein n=1 Tax=Blastomyces silverae TaxID=2060906 RepID=A0A0H1BLK4_9EURO|nr:hypothetical protein EMPG_12858 [Blastomyces silverae]
MNICGYPGPSIPPSMGARLLARCPCPFATWQQITNSPHERDQRNRTSGLTFSRRRCGTDADSQLKRAPHEINMQGYFRNAANLGRAFCGVRRSLNP